MCQPITSQCVQLTYVGSMLEGLYYIAVYSCVRQCVFEVFCRRGLDLINILRKLFSCGLFILQCANFTIDCQYHRQKRVDVTFLRQVKLPRKYKYSRHSFRIFGNRIAAKFTVFYFSYAVVDVRMRKVYLILASFLYIFYLHLFVMIKCRGMVRNQHTQWQR